MFCKNCGKEVDKNTKICNNCGSGVYETREDKKSNKNYFIILIIIIILLFLLFLIFNKNKENENIHQINISENSNTENENTTIIVEGDKIENNKSTKIVIKEESKKETTEKNNTEEIKQFNRQIENIFEGIWINSDSGCNTYFKFRKNRLDYQSNKEYYINYDSVTEVVSNSSDKSVKLKLLDAQNEVSYCNLKTVDNNTLLFEDGRELKKVENLKNVVLDLKNTFEIDLEMPNESNGLSEFLDISEADVFECFNMYRTGEISDSEISKVRSEMSPNKAKQIAIEKLDLKDRVENGSIEVLEPFEFKCGNKIGYVVNTSFIDEVDKMARPYEDVFIESSTRKIGIFVRGSEYC